MAGATATRDPGSDTVEVPTGDDQEQAAPSLEGVELPGDLQPAREKLQEALDHDVPKQFPEETKYPEASQPKLVARVLIQVVHRHLEDARFLFLYRQALNRNKAPIPGRTNCTTPLTRRISERDFILHVNWTVWKGADARERIRIVDELLSYCGRDEDSGKFVEKEVDVRAHLGPIRRWGVRDGAQEDFARAVQQLGLFDG